MVRPSHDQARVTFVLRAPTTFGQRIRLVGDHPSLGGWDVLRGIELTTSSADFPKWRISVTLPANRKLQYKYYCFTTDSTEEPNDDHPAQLEDGWEPCDDNRVVETLAGQYMFVDDGDFGDVNNRANDRVTTVSLTPKTSREKYLDREASNVASSPDSRSAGAIIAMYRLPIIAERTADGWKFDWDDDALYLTFAGFRAGLEQLKIMPLWVGILNTQEHILPEERDYIERELLLNFNCVPVFLPPETIVKFYQGFCKTTLWPVFHMLNVITEPDGKMKRFDYETWHTYQRVNRRFSEAIVEHYDGHLIWVHDYHLMRLPYYLRIKLSGVKIGFFLHIPWPSSELFRMLPVRNDILKGLLSATMLGFHLFDYARHFLSGCVRLLNLEHEAKGGSLGIEYEGRHVMIRVSHIGVDPDRFSERCGMPHVRQKAAQYESLYPSKTLLGAIDDLDLVKGVALKLMAFEAYLDTCDAKSRTNVALIQVVLPKTARTQHTVRDEIRQLVDRINSKYGSAQHKPVYYLEESISFDERMAIYSVCDALLLTPIRDGLNLIPYEYLVSTPQGKGQLILSEFTGCSRALSSAVRVNPWNTEELRNVIDAVVQRKEARDAEIRLKHEADRKYVTLHSSAEWAESFLRDLQESTEQVREVVRLGLSRSGHRSLHFEAFTMLNSRQVLTSFRSSKKRLFLFDYDGTLTSINTDSSMAHTWARPGQDVLNNLALLAQQDNCTVVILSGRGTNTDGFNLPELRSIGIAAEHGFYYRRPMNDAWEELEPGADLSWIEVAYRLMQLYTERTDGSYIEEKTAGLVWHYLAADPEFGGWQAKEMHDNLETILAPFKVQVVSGQGWLQVRLANVNKGKMVEKLLEEMDGDPDFVLCCGDDKTDEDMFAVLSDKMGSQNANLYTTTVGVKPSNARYYLRSPDEVGNLIEGLIEMALPGSATHRRSSTLEDMRPSRLRELAEQSAFSASSGALNSTDR